MGSGHTPTAALDFTPGTPKRKHAQLFHPHPLWQPQPCSQNGGPPSANAEPGQAVRTTGTQSSSSFAFQCHLPAPQTAQAPCLLGLSSPALPSPQLWGPLPRRRLGNSPPFLGIPCLSTGSVTGAPCSTGLGQSSVGTCLYATWVCTPWRRTQQRKLAETHGPAPNIHVLLRQLEPLLPSARSSLQPCSMEPSKSQLLLQM